MDGIAFLNSLPMWDGKTFSPLDVPARLFQALGNPQDAVPSIHVAGTNGKGSVAAFLAAMIFASGKTVGQHSSPHLHRVTERCIVNGRPVPESEFDGALLRVKEQCRKLGLEPTYYVASTVAAFLVFADRALDWMVIEVGLGGLYDATNLISSPQASVITTIAFDHTHVLGDSLAEIARNKAGIIKHRRPVFAGSLPVEAKEEVLAAAQRMETMVEFLGADFVLQGDEVIKAGTVVAGLGSANPLLASPYQRQNAALAARAADALGFERAVIERGLEIMRWPGRVERIRASERAIFGDGAEEERHFLLDGAHNPEGMAALFDHLDRAGCTDMIFVAGMLKRKKWEEMLAQLDVYAEEKRRKNVETRVIFTAPGHLHSLDPSVLLEKSQLPAAAVLDPKEALRTAVHAASPSSLIVVCGSLFLVGEIRALIVRDEFSTIAF